MGLEEGEVRLENATARRRDGAHRLDAGLDGLALEAPVGQAPGALE